MTGSASAGRGRTNPYVGPRALRAGEAFFGRDREQRDLANLLVAERIVLLHAPSGAGKTSLIQAGLIPQLKDKALFHPTPAVRVKTPPPEGIEVRNRYIYSVALDLLNGDRDPQELAEMTFADVVNELTPDGGGYPVLILDQFEEIVSIDPTDWKNQKIFFRELGAVLQDGHVWTLFSMREDYMGGLDRFLPYLPGQLRTTFRLDYLSRNAAKVAIQRPATELGVAFAEDAAAALVEQLVKVVVARPYGPVKEVDAPYVQPFQLQVVCRRLWDEMAKQEPGGDFEAIDLRHVQDLARIPEALADYYANAVADVASQTNVDEGAIRTWFEQDLITKDRLRTQVLAGPKTGQAAPETILQALEEARLIRRDTRGDSTWWELSHDTLIRGVIEDNRKWFMLRLQPWQLEARAWAVDRQRVPLLAGPRLREARLSANTVALNDDERAYLEESQRVENEHGTLYRMRSVVANLRFVVVVESAAIVALVIALFVR